MQSQLTNLLQKSCYALMDKVAADETLAENVHLSAEMFDGWQRKSIFIEPTLSSNKPYIFPANIVNNKFSMKDFETIINECTQDGLVASIEVIDDCDITDTMVIGLAWKAA